MTRRLEQCLWVICALSVCTYALGRHASSKATEQQLSAFEQRKNQDPGVASLALPAPDQADWSQERIDAFDPAAAHALAEGVLHIPSLEVSAPILTGTDDHTLDMAVGRVGWGATVTGAGNLILAGHRDSYFRRLGQLQDGDVLTVETLTGAWTYEITGTRIVDPKNVDAIPWTDERSITLITCYPFYFVGPAPKRYLVFGRVLADQP